MAIVGRWREWIGPIAAFLAVWGASTLYLAVRGADWSFPIASLVIFGTALPLLALFLTRRSVRPEIAVARPGVETAALLAYLLLFYALIVLGWLLGVVKAALAPGREYEVAVLLLKLLVHIALPAALLLALGGAVRPLLTAGLSRPGIRPTLIVLGAVLLGLLAVVSPSLQQIGALGAAAPVVALGVFGSFVWMSIEAGLNEEFLFRALFQTRLEALLRSPVWAVVLASFVFALAHVPGLYLRGGPGVDGWSTDPLQVAAFTLATLAPISLLFGTLWARTHSLLLVVLLHGAVDTLPNAAEFMRTWGLA